MVNSKNYLKKRAKRIIYLLSKKANMELKEFSFGEDKNGKYKSLTILRLLMKKGLVSKIPYKGYEDLYYLTEEGYKIAKPIVDEVDQYKQW